MTKLRRLKIDAKNSATFRGHSMTKFNQTGNANRAYSVCKSCGQSAWVNAKPWYNEIDIHGEAVALNCKGKVN